MLSRRQLRIKTLQAIYAFQIAGHTDIAAGEKELLLSIEKIHELYISQWSLLIEIANYAYRMMEDAKQKFFPTEEEKNPNTRFVDNPILVNVAKNKEFNKLLQNKYIQWTEHQELIKKIFLQFKASDVYAQYIQHKGTADFKEEKNIVIALLRDFVHNNELLEQIYEEKNIYFADELDYVDSLIIKTIEKMKNQEDLGGEWLYPGRSSNTEKENYKEDIEFILQLFRKTIVKQDEYEKLIEEKTKNWEMERIATIDMIMMKMALCEILEFPSIPIKATLNEYIEISKYFSSEKSKGFINGILDKIVEALKNANKIVKTGRGLKE